MNDSAHDESAEESAASACGPARKLLEALTDQAGKQLDSARGLLQVPDKEEIARLLRDYAAYISSVQNRKAAIGESGSRLGAFHRKMLRERRRLKRRYQRMRMKNQLVSIFKKIGRGFGRRQPPENDRP